MKLLDPTAKTNWKYFAIVAVAIFLVIPILWYVSFLIEHDVLIPKSRTTSPIPQQVGNNEYQKKSQEQDLQAWQTYRNEEFGFEVRYPRDWVVKPYPEYVGYFEGLVRGTTHMIWITSLNNTVRGISYCEAYPDDAPRCERLQAGGIPIIVDWDFLVLDDTLSNEPPGRLASALVGMNNEVSLNIVISDFSFEMNPQTKEFFRTFLSTFRFVE